MTLSVGIYALLDEYARSINKKRLRKMWSVHLPWTAQQYETARSELHPNENERENLIMHVHSSTVEHVLQNGVTSRAFHRHFWGGHGAYLSESVDANIEVEYGEFRSGGAVRVGE
jgi:hypothetical protein